MYYYLLFCEFVKSFFIFFSIKINIYSFKNIFLNNIAFCPDMLYNHIPFGIVARDILMISVFFDS
jgi:hypothetical protein